MKTFATNGTGSQQTLVELESEKIPVYEDLADAESDLANLAENQIIATHDTGSELSAPVDTVQSGNMHAVTSNAVAESLSYSTEEMATGGKWIDGKPIYRKVFYSATNWADETLVGSISFEIVIGIKDITAYSTPGFYCYYANYGNDGNTYCMTRVNTDGTIVAQRSGGFVNTSPSVIIVEYTKPNN